MILKREKLLSKLNILNKAYSQKTPMPILQFLKIDDDKLLLSNTSTAIECAIESTGLYILLPFKHLFDILNKLNGDDIELIQDGNKIKLKCGRSRFTLNCGTYDDYPNIAILNDVDGITINSKTFTDAVSKVNFACAKTEKRPILTGVNFTDDFIVATDSFKLAQYTDRIGLNCTITYNDINNLISILKDIDQVVVRNNGNVASFEFGDVIYQTRLLDGKYPDTTKLIKVGDINFEINKKELIDAIDRVCIFNQDNYNVIKLNINNNQLIVTNTASQVGDAQEYIDCVCNQELEIACNGEYLLECLNKFNNETITLNIVSPERPFTIIENKLTALILPVKVA